MCSQICIPLECDPEPECPIEDTYDFESNGSGGSSKDGSKDKKINTNNIIDKVKSEKLIIYP